MEVRNHGSRLDAMKNRNIFLADGKSMIKCKERIRQVQGGAA